LKPQIWDQPKNKTADELINALEKDGWTLHDVSGSSRRVYFKGPKVVSIHYHPHKSYNPKMLDYLITQMGWTEQDLKRLKLIK
jgi:predicted RNA binding protein YcfA (HicA-like mRNA interferase family)